MTTLNKIYNLTLNASWMMEYGVWEPAHVYTVKDIKIIKTRMKKALKLMDKFEEINKRRQNKTEEK